MIKQLLIVLALIQLSTQTFAFCIYNNNNERVCTKNPVRALPANQARDLIMGTIWDRHQESMNWWVEIIDERIVKESESLNATVSIDITAASLDIQEYLKMEYEQAGYHVELMLDKVPNGHTYLGLSW